MKNCLAGIASLVAVFMCSCNSGHSHNPDWVLKRADGWSVKITVANQTDATVMVDPEIVERSFIIYDQEGNELPTYPLSYYEATIDDAISIGPGQSHTFSVDLRENYPDDIIDSNMPTRCKFVFDYGTRGGISVESGLIQYEVVLESAPTP